MATFQMQVVTMDGLQFEGEVERIKLRSAHGDIAILANHIDYCTAIGMGVAKVVLPDKTERYAACIGGMLSVMNNVVRVIPTTWEWSEDIDLERALAAKERAEQRLKEEQLSKKAQVNAEAKLYRALVRISAASPEM